MKKSLIFLSAVICVVLVTFFTCCKEEKSVEPPVVVDEPAPVEVYQPKHQSFNVDLSTAKTYEYVNAPTKTSATSVTVDYDPKVPYAKPITIKYTYSNGDTYTFIIPKEFGLWENEAGRFRVVTDNECTVWVQGQTKKGKFHEFIFYGDPKFNGKKIKPNSYLNHPTGMIKYKE